MTMERELKGWSFELKREEGDGVKWSEERRVWEF